MTIPNRNGAVPLTAKSMSLLIAAMAGLLTIATAVLVPITSNNTIALVDRAVDRHGARAHEGAATKDELRDVEKRHDQALERIDRQLTEIRADLKALRAK